ncbi:unnamed protein product [Penicillium pancosmium]
MRVEFPKASPTKRDERLHLLNRGWLDQNDTSFPLSTKEDGMPEFHHPYPMSLYRMAWNETPWPRKSDTNARVQSFQFHSIKNMNIDSEALNGVNGDISAPDMTDSSVESSLTFNLDDLQLRGRSADGPRFLSGDR